MINAPRPTDRITVAVVEDDPEVRSLLCEWLDQEPGFACVANYRDAEEALAQLPEAPVRPVVALIDINLPGLNGIDCVRRLKPLLPATQFVMVTVYEDADHIFAALAGGATGYLLKRTGRDELLRAIREVHLGGSPMSSNIARKIVQSFQQPTGSTSQAEALSPRENEVLSLLARGFLYKEVADQIGISIPTVKTYIRRICEKLQVRSRSEANALYANLPRRRPPSEPPV